MGDPQESIIQGINAEIMMHLRRQRSEERHPSFDADKMDDTIKFHREQVEKLRMVRQDLEEIFAAVAP